MTEQDPTVPAGERGTPGQFVQSLARGLGVITAFDARHPRMTLSDVARRTGLTRATARRFLLTLDGRTARTPGKQPLAVPSRGLAEALAEEWQGQGAEIDPSTVKFGGYSV